MLCSNSCGPVIDRITELSWIPFLIARNRTHYLLGLWSEPSLLYRKPEHWSHDYPTFYNLLLEAVSIAIQNLELLVIGKLLTMAHEVAYMDPNYTTCFFLLSQDSCKRLWGRRYRINLGSLNKTGLWINCKRFPDWLLNPGKRVGEDSLNNDCGTTLLIEHLL